jgi:RHS repeat-associated protein
MALYLGTAALKPRVHPGNQDNLSRTHSGCLYWYRSRHYSPGIGRFSQADKWQSSVMNPVGNHIYSYVMGNPVIWKDPYGLKFYDFKTSSKAEILNGIKNDDWFIFSGHGSASHFYQPTYLHSEFIGSFIYPKMYAPASISPEKGYGEWSISLYDEDFSNAIKERKDSGKKLEMSIFFACESVEMAKALVGISDVSIGMENSENKFVLWKYAELFSAAVESGKSISKAILAAENLGSDFLNMVSQSTLRRISYSITNPVVKNVEYDPKNFYLENCDKKGE